MTAYTKANPIRNDAFRREWAERHLAGGCQVCFADGRQWSRQMEVHHLIRGVGRSDEGTNLLLLCGLCHRVHHGERIMVGLKYVPELTLGMLLTVKIEHDAAEYDGDRLAVLLRRPLPALDKLPDWFLAERGRNRP